MDSTKLTAFLLGLASLAGLLFVGYQAVAAPFSPVPRPWPLNEWPPAVLSLVMFAMLAPLAMIPGLAGLGLWYFVVRKREAAIEREASVLPEQEITLQSRLDNVVRHVLAVGGDASSMAAAIPAWTRNLEEAQRSRLLRFLAEWGSGAPVGRVGHSHKSEREQECASADWGRRALSLGLFGFAGFCLLWTCFMAFIYLATDAGSLVKEIGSNVGIEVPSGMQPADMFIASLGCLPPGLAALFGGLALPWLLRRDEVRRRRHAAFGQRAQEITAESCLRRIESLFPEHGRIARADVVCTLVELDGTARGRLIAQLQSKGLLSRISLSGADLRGVVLTEMDLSGVIFTGSDLSGAHLGGIRLTRADLSGSRLTGADLRGADASGAILRNADLRQARMHRCVLRDADLRSADLEGANLWQADLSGADLAEARITEEQLRSTTGRALP